MSRLSRNSREERRRHGDAKYGPGSGTDTDSHGAVGRTTVVDVDGVATAGLVGQDAMECEHLDIGDSGGFVSTFLSRHFCLDGPCSLFSPQPFG